jgi:hypothetical protein
MAIRFRLFLAALFLGAAVLASAQDTLPEDPTETPDGGVPPADPPDLPPDLTAPPLPSRLLTPNPVDGSMTVVLFQALAANETGSWESSTDLASWAAVAPSQQVGSLVSLEWKVNPGQTIFLRWRKDS